MANPANHELLALVRATRQLVERALREGHRAISPGAVAPHDQAGAPPPRAARALPMVRQELGDCQRCTLAPGRTQLVFGNGAATASLMFVGDAPSAEDDQRGEPFAGPAGELLANMIRAMGWARDEVYITNLVKCRPPADRPPEVDELAACAPWFAAQIQAVSPRVIVALGQPAANALLGNQAPLAALRGAFHAHQGIAVMPTFHPAYLLRSPEKKREAWQDLQAVMAELARLGVGPKARP